MTITRQTCDCRLFFLPDLFEEKALLLGQLGRHEVALALYAHVLKDPKMAEDYCKRTYDPDSNREVETHTHTFN